MKIRNVAIGALLFLSILWILIFFCRPSVTKAKAKQIVAQALTGKNEVNGDTKVSVFEYRDAFKVVIIRPVPEGKEGEAYQIYGVVDKKKGEVLEVGVGSPEDDD